MCDTLCALPEWARSSHTLLAKNSDRDPNEPHVILAIPAQEHNPGAPLRCTYINIPQAPHTHAVLLFKPDWTWGTEMGVNEYGVAIGNELYLIDNPLALAPAQAQHVNIAVSEKKQDTGAAVVPESAKAKGWSNPLVAALIVVGGAVIIGLLIEASTDSDEQSGSPF